MLGTATLFHLMRVCERCTDTKSAKNWRIHIPSMSKGPCATFLEYEMTCVFSGTANTTRNEGARKERDTTLQLTQVAGSHSIEQKPNNKTPTMNKQMQAATSKHKLPARKNNHINIKLTSCEAQLKHHTANSDNNNASVNLQGLHFVLQCKCLHCYKHASCYKRAFEPLLKQHTATTT